MNPVPLVLPALAAVLILSGCGGSAGSGNQNPNGNGNGADAAADLDAAPVDASADASVTPDAGDPVRPRFQVCDQDPLPEGLPTVEWNHATSAITVATGDPDHSAQDPITVVGRAEPIVGKFAYGAVSKDLQDEWIEVWIDRCEGALVKLGEVLTDTDGRVALEIPAAELPPVGAYATWLRVMGDGTATRSVLRVVMPGTHVVVMDIDGTLTTSDTELFQDIFADLFGPLGTGDYVPVARAGALDLTLRRGPSQGYLLVYMTGRPYYLTDISRGWLADLGMAPAHLHLTDSNAEAMPTEGGVGTYKADYLAHLQGMGLLLDIAYGNATTDIYAYAQAGIDLAATFIVGDNGGTDGTVAVGDDYVAHLAAVAGEPAVVQPFDW
jgi:phosphatidate phosphatase PAH1